MIGSDSIKEIANIFWGDIGDYYTYKSGPKLVRFFNDNFGATDVYRSGFPSRWVYVYDKINLLISNHSIDSFLNKILSKAYLMQEQSLSEIEAVEKIEKIYNEFNRVIQKDLCKITRNNGRYHLVKENDDLEPIGNGGFANVYLQKSTGLVLKKLKIGAHKNQSASTMPTSVYFERSSGVGSGKAERAVLTLKPLRTRPAKT